MISEKLCRWLVCLIAMLGLVLPACRISVAGSPNILTSHFDNHGFSELQVSNGFEVRISPGPVFSLSVTVNENLMSYLDIRQWGKKLFIGLQFPGEYVDTVRRADIVIPELKRLDLSDGARAEIQGWSIRHPVYFSLTGGSTLHLDEFEAFDAWFEVRNASRLVGTMYGDFSSFKADGGLVDLSGFGADISIEAESSEFRLAGFQVRDVHLKLRDTHTTLNTTGMLLGELRGSSQLNYLGNPLRAVKVFDQSFMTRMRNL